MMTFYHGWGWQPPQTAPPSILDIYKVLEHIDMMVTIGIQQQPYTVIPILLGSDCGVLGHMSCQNNVTMSWLRLTATSIRSSPIHLRHIQSAWTHWYAVHRHFVAALHSYPYYLARGVLGHMSSQNDVITLWLRLTATSNCFLHPY